MAFHTFRKPPGMEAREAVEKPESRRMLGLAPTRGRIDGALLTKERRGEIATLDLMEHVRSIAAGHATTYELVIRNWVSSGADPKARIDGMTLVDYLESKKGDVVHFDKLRVLGEHMAMGRRVDPRGPGSLENNLDHAIRTLKSLGG